MTTQAPETLTFAPERLTAIAAAAFEAAGADAEGAAMVARSLVLSNLKGVDSHGIVRVPDYLRAIAAGRIDPAARPSVVRDEGALLQVDGNRAFGQVAAREVILLGVTRAARESLALTTLRNVVHVGRVGEFVELAAEQGCVGIAWCNGGPPGGNVVPFGGRRGILGTNPLAYAFPAREHDPIVADFSTSIAAEGKIRLHSHSARPLPEPWVVDPEGSPSTDPDLLYNGGAILPAAGHKGFALGLLVELLGGVVAGAGCASLGVDPGNGIVFLVLDADRLGLDRGTVDAVVDAVEAVPPAPGFSAVTVPGRPESRTFEARAREGIPLARETWRQVVDAVRSVGVDIEAN